MYETAVNAQLDPNWTETCFLSPQICWLRKIRSVEKFWLKWKKKKKSLILLLVRLVFRRCKRGKFLQRFLQLPDVATSPVALRWMCDSPRTDVREEQQHISVARTSNNRVIAEHDLYCCLLPQCDALRTCRSGFPIATKWCCDQDVKIVPGSAFKHQSTTARQIVKLRSNFMHKF